MSHIILPEISRSEVEFVLLILIFPELIGPRMFFKFILCKNTSANPSYPESAVIV
nr:MAG TPA: hypothetical protein [Caudoviricetes sp.]